VGAGPKQRRIAIELNQVNRSWQGSYHRLERGVESGDLAEVVVAGDSVRFRAVAAPGDPRFAGQLSGDELKGVALGQASEPFALVRVPATAGAGSLGGRWFGWLAQSGTPVMRLGLNILPAPCRQFLVTMDSPDQGAENLPVSSVAIAGDSLWFAMLYINGSYAGALNGDSLIGQWTQGGTTLDLRLGRRDSTRSLRRPQEPVAPFPYSSTEVAYQSQVDSITLAGTLTIPEGEGPFPAVLLITGSGAQDRNETVMGHRPFLVLADYLTRRGIAVLRVDDRGVEGSGGNTFASTIADNAGDALSGVQFLRNHPKIDRARVGLLGHSEGGWVAPLAASRSRDVAFIVLIAGPAVTGEAIRQVQDSLLALAAGGSLNQVAAGQRITRAVHEALKQEPNDSLAVVRMIQAIDSAYEALPPALKAAVDSGQGPRDSAALAAQLRPIATPWYRFLLTYDPLPALRSLRIPVLAIFGEKDLQVPPAQSAPIMRGALSQNRRASVHVFPGLNHLFQHAETGAVGEYGRIEETFAEEALAMIGDFVRAIP
jgi:pimeloyl-ACP methyl ester carboxylesterase